MMVLKLAGLFLSVAMASAGECTDPKMEEWYVWFNSIRLDSIRFCVASSFFLSRIHSIRFRVVSSFFLSRM